MLTGVVSSARGCLGSPVNSCLTRYLSSSHFSPALRLLRSLRRRQTLHSNMAFSTAALRPRLAHHLREAQPKIQDYWYSTRDGAWQTTPFTQTTVPVNTSPPLNSKAIRLLSWNIDFLVGFSQERMSAALRYLGETVSSTAPEVPIVIFLQEMVQSDLLQIRESKWIRERFHVTDFDNRNWHDPQYGTTTLIDRRLAIQSVFRVPWVSNFGRDGLFVDIALTNPQSLEGDSKVLRLCNTHLESLVADPPLRPLQLALASHYLTETDVACALLAGDLNAIQPFDRTLHSELDLKDAYLELGGQEDSHDGYTWGYQVAQWKRDRFGCSRMDKILLRGAILPGNFERIGMGVMVAEDVREEVEESLEGPWVTDHYGVMGDLELTEEWVLQSCDSGGDEKTKPMI
jgi:tyrosyl-DNA phosphodiesterase 2